MKNTYIKSPINYNGNKYKLIGQIIPLFPDKINMFVDEFGGIFWSWLVLRYGDYGTSPRYGWIYKEDAKKLFMIQMENMLLSKTIRRYDV